MPARRRAWLRVHADGRYLDADETFLRETGFSGDELRQLRMGLLSLPEHADRARTVWRRFVGGEIDIPMGREAEVVRRDGTYVMARSVELRRTDDHSWTLTLEFLGRHGIAVAQRGSVVAALAAWRAAEQRLGQLSEDAPERADLTAEIEDLRRIYHLESTSLRNDGKRPFALADLADGLDAAGAAASE